MSGWTSTNREPIERKADLDHLPAPRKKADKAQFEAAKEAAAKLLTTFDGKVNVNLSGAEAQVQITMAAE